MKIIQVSNCQLSKCQLSSSLSNYPLLRCFGRTQPITIPPTNSHASKNFPTYPSNILHTPNQFTIGIPESFGGDFGDDWGMVWGLHSIAPHPAIVQQWIFVVSAFNATAVAFFQPMPTLQSDGFIGIFYNKHAEEPYALTSIFFFRIVGAKIGGTNLGATISLPIWLVFFLTFFMAKFVGESSTDSWGHYRSWRPSCGQSKFLQGEGWG